MPSERVTITLPADVVRDIDRLEQNRSRFVLRAVREELLRRRRYEFERSIRNPHPESLEIAEEGLSDWARGLPQEDCENLLDPELGKDVQWIPGRGWIEIPN